MLLQHTTAGPRQNGDLFFNVSLTLQQALRSARSDCPVLLMYLCLRLRLWLSTAVFGLLLSGCAQHMLKWPANHTATPAARTNSATGLYGAFQSLPASVSASTAVLPLEDNAAAWIARWRMLAEANESIDIAYFILSQDIFGMSLLGHLLKKARNGVEVRLLIDAQGRLMSEESHGLDCLPALTQVPNITVKSYRPLPRRISEALFTLSPLPAAASNHDKIIVADGKTSLIGGRNIADEYFAHPSDSPKAFNDLDVLLEGQAVAEALTGAFETLFLSDQVDSLQGDDGQNARCLQAMQQAYVAMDEWLRTPQSASAQSVAFMDSLWQRQVRQFAALRAGYDRPLGEVFEAQVAVLDSLPRLASLNDPISQSLFRLLGGTQREVFIENPYLVFTDEIAQAFREAGQRAVDVTVLTNSPVSSDNALSQDLFRDQWPELLAFVPGLRIFVSGSERNMHSKFAIFDGQVTLLGAFNLDPISMAINGEIAVAVWSEPLARRLLAEPRRLLAHGPPLVYQYRILRNSDGYVVRTETGEPVIAFGPRDHSDPSQWKQTGWLWRLLNLATCHPSAPSIFRGPPQ